MLAITLLSIVLEVLASAVRQENKKGKASRLERKKKSSLYSQVK